MGTELVRYQRRGPAAVLTLNRPERRNALNRDVVSALRDCYLRADQDETVAPSSSRALAPFSALVWISSELQQSIQCGGAEGVVWEDACGLASSTI